MASTNQHITLSEGESRPVFCTVTDSNGSLSDLSGYTLSWKASPDYDSASVISRSHSDFVTTSASSGSVAFAIAASDSVGLSGRYKHELRASSGSEVRSLLTGELIIRKSIFHPPTSS